MDNLYFGNLAIDNITLGNSEISAIWLGGTQIYPAGANYTYELTGLTIYYTNNADCIKADNSNYGYAYATYVVKKNNVVQSSTWVKLTPVSISSNFLRIVGNNLYWNQAVYGQTEVARGTTTVVWQYENTQITTDKIVYDKNIKNVSNSYINNFFIGGTTIEDGMTLYIPGEGGIYEVEIDGEMEYTWTSQVGGTITETLTSLKDFYWEWSEGEPEWCIIDDDSNLMHVTHNDWDAQRWAEVLVYPYGAYYNGVYFSISQEIG